MERLLSGKKLAERLNLPPWGILDDLVLNDRIEILPLDPVTGTEILPPGWESALNRIQAKICILADETLVLKRNRKAAIAALQFLKAEAPETELTGPAGSILGSAANVHPKWHIFVNGRDNPDLQYDSVQLEFQVKELETKLIHACRYLWALKRVKLTRSLLPIAP